MQEFSYAQALEYYKDNFENFKRLNKNIFFEQDGHKKNKEILGKIIWR